MRSLLLRLPAAVLVVVLAIATGSTPTALNASDLGSIDFDVTTSNEEARRAFLDGLAALHSFWYEEAAIHFRRARELDPALVLAYWGEAMTHDHPLWNQQDREAAVGVLEELAPDPAGRAARAATERERGYLEAAETLFGTAATADLPVIERRLAWGDALKRLAARHPDDEDAAAFFALSLQVTARPGAWGIQARMRSAAVLERLLDQFPTHPGVLHYLIHAYDDPLHASLGLRPAVVYADVAPAAPHALHMPSHIFVQLGLWDRAVASNIDAWNASTAWADRRDLDESHHDFHSLGWLNYAHLQRGQRRAAAETIALAQREAIALGTERHAGIVASMLAHYLVETGADGPDDILLAAGYRPGATPHHSQADLELALSIGAARSGVATETENPFDEFGEPMEHAAADPRCDAAEEPRGPESHLRHLMVEGTHKIARGNVDEGLEILARAADLEASGEAPSGPPVPAQPALELYGEALLAAGRPAEAAVQFEGALLRTPNRPRALLGAARAARAAGQPDQATAMYRQLATVWSQADTEYPELEEARAGAVGS